jgi:hypothetical protein
MVCAKAAEAGPAPGALLVSFPELAVMLGRCVKTLRKALQHGRLPPPVFCYGRGKMSWSRAAIELWVRHGCPPVARRRKGGAGHAR